MGKLLRPCQARPSSFADPVWSRRAAALRPPPDSICERVRFFFFLDKFAFAIAFSNSASKLGSSWRVRFCTRMRSTRPLRMPTAKASGLACLPSCCGCLIGGLCDLALHRPELLSFSPKRERERENLEHPPSTPPAAQLGSIRQKYSKAHTPSRACARHSPLHRVTAFVGLFRRAASRVDDCRSDVRPASHVSPSASSKPTQRQRAQAGVPSSFGSSSSARGPKSEGISRGHLPAPPRRLRHERSHGKSRTAARRFPRYKRAYAATNISFFFSYVVELQSTSALADTASP